MSEVIVISLGVLTAALMGPLVTLLYLMYRRSARGAYDFQNERARLSEPRASVEGRIIDLNERLARSEAMWSEANHLILASLEQSSRSAQGVDPGLSRFLATVGVKPVSVDPGLVFVRTPFHDREFGAWEVIRDTCADLGLRALRGDESFVEPDILRHVLQLMSQARLVIANISGRNANVFYELGIANGIDKPTLVVSEGVVDLPFDVSSRRLIVFHSTHDLREQLMRAIPQALAEAPSERSPRVPPT